MLIWTEWPIKSQSRDIIFQSGDLNFLASFNDESGGTMDAENSDKTLAFRNARMVSLNWTPIIRIGDFSRVTLKFSKYNNPLTDNFENESMEPEESQSFINIFDVCNVNSEARIELSGFYLDPAGISGQVLSEDQDIVYIWKISPAKEGYYDGVAWLYLQLIPIDDGILIEQAVSAQSFDIKAVSILGFNSNYWRVIGVLGIIIGIYLQKERINRLFADVNRIKSIN
ncbi:MAG: hypothetical protein ABIJ65_00900 [Chloroflexota bacterium]